MPPSGYLGRKDCPGPWWCRVGATSWSWFWVHSSVWSWQPCCWGHPVSVGEWEQGNVLLYHLDLKYEYRKSTIIELKAVKYHPLAFFCDFWVRRNTCSRNCLANSQSWNFQSELTLSQVYWQILGFQEWWLGPYPLSYDSLSFLNSCSFPLKSPKKFLEFLPLKITRKI